MYIKSQEYKIYYPTFTPYNVQKDIIYIYEELIANLLLKRVKNKRLSIDDLVTYRLLKNKQDRDSDDNEKIINIENKYKGKPYELFNILRGNSMIDLKE